MELISSNIYDRFEELHQERNDGLGSEPKES